MEKKQALGIFLFTAVFMLLTACRSTINFSAPLSGRYSQVRLPEKNFIILGHVSATSMEIHTIKPFGIVKKVEGRKLTHNDLVIKAAELDADDIINVTIDIKTNGKTGFIYWLKGWERIFYYSGYAVAIKYIDEDEDNYEDEDVLSEILNR